MNTKLAKNFLFHSKCQGSDIGYIKGGRDGKEDNVHFLLLEAFSLATSILKYSPTSSTGVSSFYSVALGVLVWAGALQGLEGLSSYGFGLENGIGGFVTP